MLHINRSCDVPECSQLLMLSCGTEASTICSHINLYCIKQSSLLTSLNWQTFFSNSVQQQMYCQESPEVLSVKISMQCTVRGNFEGTLNPPTINIVAYRPVARQ
jgi:hypothetical protein